MCKSRRQTCWEGHRLGECLSHNALYIAPQCHLVLVEAHDLTHHCLWHRVLAWLRDRLRGLRPRKGLRFHNLWWLFCSRTFVLAYMDTCQCLLCPHLQMLMRSFAASIIRCNKVQGNQCTGCRAGYCPNQNKLQGRPGSRERLWM